MKLKAVKCLLINKSTLKPNYKKWESAKYIFFLKKTGLTAKRYKLIRK